jgi:hypothetical protein
MSAPCSIALPVVRIVPACEDLDPKDAFFVPRFLIYFLSLHVLVWYTISTPELSCFVVVGGLTRRYWTVNYY